QIDLSPLDYLSKNVTVRLVYASPKVGDNWRKLVKRDRVRFWAVEYDVMKGWRAQMKPDTDLANQDRLWKWVRDNVDYRVRRGAIRRFAPPCSPLPARSLDSLAAPSPDDLWKSDGAPRRARAGGASDDLDRTRFCLALAWERPLTKMRRGGGRLMTRRFPDSAGVGDQSAVGPRGVLKRGIQRIFKRFGYQIMRFPALHSHERHIGRLLSTLAVNCVLD